MHELELVRELRAEVPPPTRECLSTGRERLMVAIATAPTHSQTRHAPAPARHRTRHRRVRAIRTALVACAAAALAVIVADGFRGAAQPGGARIHASLADQVLRSAALNAASQPAVTPRPDQWIYARAVSYSWGGGRTSSESWARFDGRETAYYQGRQLIVHATSATPAGSSPVNRFLDDPTPSTACRALSSLPKNPVQLLAAVAKDVPAASMMGSGWDSIAARPSRGQLEFGFLADLLWNSAQAAPARAEAAAFHAMAMIPGVRAQRGVTDAAGRPDVALSIVGVGQQLLLAPRTYQVAGERTVSDGHWPTTAKAAEHTIAKGTVVEATAWARIRFVRLPGMR